jgi:CheY-like chemotaxis protein
MNLVANARDALPNGGIVNIRTSIADNMEPLPGTEIISGTSYAVISVSDNGLGMNEDTRNKVFEPFFTTKEIGKGTGLGLSTVYGIISQHKGTITVTSEPGCGTTFSIYLPLLDQAISESQETQESTISFATGGTELILLAEDNAETRSVTEEILMAAGYEVISTANGEEAIKKYREHGNRINLVLMDVIMPIKNGREVYEEVKRLNPLARCLFTSGYTADIIHTKGKIDKEFDYLPKPSRPNDMLNKIREILDRA